MFDEDTEEYWESSLQEISRLNTLIGFMKSFEWRGGVLQDTNLSEIGLNHPWKYFFLYLVE